MNNNWVLLSALLASIASGCVNTGDTASNSVSAPRTTASEPSDFISADFVRVGALEAQAISDGDCGLFLFSGRPAPRFVFFGEAASGVGKMLINDKEVIFARTATEGTAFDLHFTFQEYKAPAIGLKVSIDIEPELDGGAIEGTRISRGTLKMEREDGWSMVMPVGGATTCKANS